MKPTIYTQETHGINPSHIDKNALFVLDRLRQAGFIAFLVGGSVRDLLLGKQPKDFDISTSALPEQIKKLFRHCFLIGRRFRLAHIKFGHHIIETATFRSGNTDEEELIVRDNNWGNPEEDALRRDFTINGLFYENEQGTIIDYVGGFEDIKKNLIKTIGDPFLRFKQDPVRMIRLLKFIARFKLDVDEQSLQALVACKHEILKSSPARILEEFLRMLESGSSLSFFELMKEYGFFHILMPNLEELFLNYHSSITNYLKVADELVQEGIKIERATLLTSFFFPALDKQIELFFLNEGRTPHFGEIFECAQSLIHKATNSSFSHFPKKIVIQIIDILVNQYRMTPLVKPKTSKKRKFISNQSFNASLDFLKMRSLIDKRLENSFTSWKNKYEKQDLAKTKEANHTPQHAD